MTENNTITGYRSESLFGSAVTDPTEVAFYETWDLGNSDIPMTLLKSRELNTPEKEYLKAVIDFIQGQDLAVPIEADKEYFREIIRKACGDRNYCKWLCRTPEDIWHNYVKPMSGYADVELKDFLPEITEYRIPEEAVVLADLGTEGALYAWRAGDETKEDPWRI